MNIKTFETARKHLNDYTKILEAKNAVIEDLKRILPNSYSYGSDKPFLFDFKISLRLKLEEITKQEFEKIATDQYQKFENV